MSKSDYVCAHCGLAVHWRINDWKHIGNRFTQSCGQPPKPEPRLLYELRQKGDK